MLWNLKIKKTSSGVTNMATEKRIISQRKARKKYYELHKEELLEKTRNWRQANKEKISVHNKQYRKDHKEDITAQRKQFNIDHREEKAAYNKKYHAAHKEDRRIRLLNDHGLTEEPVVTSCNICGTKDFSRSNGGKFHIDHDHKTGQVRGFLCHCCNLLLGYAKDNIEILAIAIEYLKNPPYQAGAESSQ
jgi:hypothetical protein